MNTDYNPTSEELEKLEAVYQHFGISREKVFWMVIDYGTRYLRRTLPTDDATYAKFRACPRFWTWFRKRWDAVDLSISAKLGDFNNSIDVYTSAHHNTYQHCNPCFLFRSYLNELQKTTV